MIFINPKIDFAFKKIFGSEDSKDILISFLNALIYEEKPVIQDLEIINPYVAPKIRGVKNTYLDIKAKITDAETGEQRTVIIEMQVLNVEGFEKRILYNAAKSYSTQLLSGQGYNLLNPVIALTITDFVMFTELSNVVSRFILKEKDFLIDYPIYDIELIFVELPKFKKQLVELETIVDKWLYFLSNARSLPQVPAIMEEIPEIKKAFYIANQANLTPDELEDQEKEEIYIQDQRGVVSKALKQGLEQGLEQGREQGLEQGLLQGAKREKVAIARKMLLNLMDDRTICEVTGLSASDLESLKTSKL